MVMTKDNEGVRYLALLLDNHMFKVFNLDDDEWKDVTLNRPYVSRLKFLGESDVDLSSSDYTVSLSNFSYTYKFNSGVSCKKVLLADAEVWKHTDDSNFSDIKSFQLDLPTNKFFVTNSTDQTKELTLSQPGKPASQPASPSGGTTQPPKTSSGTPASQSASSGSRAAQTRSGDCTQQSRTI